MRNHMNRPSLAVLALAAVASLASISASADGLDANIFVVNSAPQTLDPQTGFNNAGGVVIKAGSDENLCINTEECTPAAQTVPGYAELQMVPGGQTNSFYVDANGHIQAGESVGNTAALVVRNGAGNYHGILINESQTTISGGTTSSSLTLDDNGARFSNAHNGAPITVTGVADGKNDYDAVNVRQYAGAIAAVVAAANVPAIEGDKTTSVGIGTGYFMGKAALAFGLNHRPMPNMVFKANVAMGTENGAKPVFGMGAGWSW